MNHYQKLIDLGEAYPDQKRQLFKYFRHQPSALETFVITVDISDHAMCDWLDALDRMSEWLEGKGLVLSLKDKIQYLNCASEIVDQMAKCDSMASAILLILEQYGCERSTDETNKNF